MTSNRKQKQQARAVAAASGVRYPDALRAIRRPHPGDRVRFDGKTTSWLAREGTSDGRYLLCTASVFGKTVYTIVDFDEQVRGPLNVVGHGMGIHTTRGPDPAIVETLDRLDQPGDQWCVSHRNQVPLQITRVDRAESGEDFWRDDPRATQPAWGGESDPDPLTFWVGVNASGADVYLSLATVPHVDITGVSGSGKSTLAEVLAAQVAVTPTPWDPNTYGQVHIVDFDATGRTAVLAPRWRGRPNVVVSDGLSGADEWATHVASIRDEQDRRQVILSSRRTPSWCDLPDEVKRSERLAPVLVVVDGIPPSNRRELSGHIARLAATGSATGVHVVATGSDAELRGNPSTVAITGSQSSGFGRPITGLPRLPRAASGPGWLRLRPAPAGGSEAIRTLCFEQPNTSGNAPGFGGANIAALDKWLPRGATQPRLRAPHL